MTTSTTLLLLLFAASIFCLAHGGDIYKLRAVAVRPACVQGSEYIGFNNYTCTVGPGNKTVGPQFKTSASLYRNWEVIPGGSKDGLYMVSFKPYYRTKKLLCNGNMTVKMPSTNSCNEEATHMKEGSSGYRWLLQPIFNERNTFFLIASTRGSGCKRYLTMKNSCDKSLYTYAQPYGGRSQFILELVGETKPIIIATEAVDNTAVSLEIDPPSKGTPPVKYRIRMEPTCSTNCDGISNIKTITAYKPYGDTTRVVMDGLSKCKNYTISVTGVRPNPGTETPTARKYFKTGCLDTPPAPTITSVVWNTNCAIISMAALSSKYQTTKYCASATVSSIPTGTFTCFNSPTLSITRCGLSRYNDYYYHVYAINARGPGPLSTVGPFGPLSVSISQFEKGPGTSCSIRLGALVQWDPLLGNLTYTLEMYRERTAGGRRKALAALTGDLVPSSTGQLQPGSGVSLSGEDSNALQLLRDATSASSADGNYMFKPMQKRRQLQAVSDSAGVKLPATTTPNLDSSLPSIAWSVTSCYILRNKGYNVSLTVQARSTNIAVQYADMTIPADASCPETSSCGSG